MAKDDELYKPMYFPLRFNSPRVRASFSPQINLIRADSPQILKVAGFSCDIHPGTSYVTRWGGLDNLAAQRRFMVRIMCAPKQFGPVVVPENFFIVATDRAEATKLRLAILLNFATESVPTYGFSDLSKNSFKFDVGDPPVHWRETLRLDNSVVAAIRKTIKLLDSNKNQRMDLITGKFLNSQLALPGGHAANVFEHVSLQELILLPEKQSELTFRYRYRLAKVFEKYYGDDPAEMFERARDYYEARSSVVHRGSCNGAKELVPELAGVSRKLMLAYLTDPDNFKDAPLDALCLSG
jgi:hypothetical protein